MKIKKYEVTDMKEALRMIKEDLGPDAVILSTRKVMKSNNFGLFARPVLEVTAAVEYDGMPAARKKTSFQTATRREPVQSDFGYEAYPSAYATVTKKQTPRKPAVPVEKQSIPQTARKHKTVVEHTGYGPYAHQNTYNIQDDYLSEAMAEAGITDDEPFYAPPVRKRKVQEDDVIPAYMPEAEEEYYEPVRKPQKKEKYEEPVVEKSISREEEIRKQAEINAERMAAVIKAVGLDKFTSLLDDIGDIKKQISSMQNNISDNIAVDLPAKLKDYHALFIKNGVDDIISYRLLKEIEMKIDGKEATPVQIKSIAVDKLAELIPLEKNYAEVMTSRIIALAGPTGVGKTTTIAKIAASLTLKYGKKVCLITVDNFRIGAVEQLKTYAEIVNLPLYVATSPEELARIIAKVKGKYDSILIDSMGRGQFDSEQIAGIRSFFQVDSRITTALVLSMASNHIELYDTFDRYEILKPDYLIFTKLDETKYFGPLINIPVKKKLPLLLVTTGQNVPDDMEVPDGKKIARRMLQEIPTLWSDK